MINFIICSSDYSSREETKNIIYSYMMNYDVEVKYHLFEHYNKELKNIIEREDGYNVYILDLDCSIEIIKKIREEQDDWHSIIILITNNSIDEKIYGKRLYILDLIYRNKSYEKLLIEDLKRILNNYDHREKCLTFETNRVIKKVDFKSIIMITKEKDSKKCILKSSYGNYSVPESLCNISKRLDDRFVKTNRSCIVNGDQIIEYDQNQNKITLKNGLIFNDISREKRKSVSKYVINR